MLRRVTTAATTLHPRRRHHSSSAHHNYFLRKNRKWPSYNSHYQQTFASQLAIKSFKQKSKSKPHHLLSTFLASFAEYETHPTPKSYHTLLKTLIQTNKIDQIPHFLDHIKNSETLVTPECLFVDLISFYGSRSMVSEAVDLFLRIPSFRCQPTVDSLNSLLLFLCKTDIGRRRVPEILSKGSEMGIGVEESSFEILIRALCGVGDVSGAFELVRLMKEEGGCCVVDASVLRLMLATKCRKAGSGGEVLGFLEILRGLGFEARKEDLRNVVRCLVANGTSGDALKALRKMRVDPDVASYNLVLEKLVAEGEFGKADKVFDELLVLGLVPDVVTYNVYVRGLCLQGKVEEGMRMVVAMEELGCAPNSCTYGPILRALSEAGEVRRARELVNEMKRRNVELSLETCEFNGG